MLVFDMEGYSDPNTVMPTFMVSPSAIFQCSYSTPSLHTSMVEKRRMQVGPSPFALALLWHNIVHSIPRR